MKLSVDLKVAFIHAIVAGRLAPAGAVALETFLDILPERSKFVDEVGSLIVLFGFSEVSPKPFCQLLLSRGVVLSLDVINNFIHRVAVVAFQDCDQLRVSQSVWLGAESKN